MTTEVWESEFFIGTGCVDFEGEDPPEGYRKAESPDGTERQK